MTAHASYATHRGDRPSNEDAVLCAGVVQSDDAAGSISLEAQDAGSILLGVADGMGGCGDGATASRRVLEQIAEARPQSEQQWLEAVDSAHCSLQSLARFGNGSCPGTTLAALLWDRAGLHCVNVGDSAVYRLNSGYLMQLSTDDRSRRLSACEQADWNGAMRNTLTQAIGGSRDKPPPRLHFRSLGALPARHLLCTDGVTDTLGMQTIEETLDLERSVTEAASRLRKQLLGRGSRDNFTFIVADTKPDMSA